MLSVKNIRTRQFSLLKNIKFYYTESNDIKKLRNIGILAHIDAGNQLVVYIIILFVNIPYILFQEKQLRQKECYFIQENYKPWVKYTMEIQ